MLPTFRDRRSPSAAHPQPIRGPSAAHPRPIRGPSAAHPRPIRGPSAAHPHSDFLCYSRIETVRSLCRKLVRQFFTLAIRFMCSTFCCFLLSELCFLSSRFKLLSSAHKCSVPKKTVTFILFLSSRMLCAQENDYFYSVSELTNALRPPKPVYLLCF